MMQLNSWVSDCHIKNIGAKLIQSLKVEDDDC